MPGLPLAKALDLFSFQVLTSASPIPEARVREGRRVGQDMGTLMELKLSHPQNWPSLPPRLLSWSTDLMCVPWAADYTLHIGDTT
jgi:hypothetical protein